MLARRLSKGRREMKKYIIAAAIAAFAWSAHAKEIQVAYDRDENVTYALETDAVWSKANTKTAVVVRAQPDGRRIPLIVDVSGCENGYGPTRIGTRVVGQDWQYHPGVWSASGSRI